MANDCSAPSVLSRNVTIAYGAIYGLFLIIVSVYSFNLLMKYNSKFIQSSSIQKFKIWSIDAWRRRKCYVPIIAHIFDQITDVSVTIQFYILAKTKYDNGNWTDCQGLNIWYLFILTILSMITYRVISSYLIYQSTKSVQRIFIQLLDFELLRALYINYLCNKQSPCSPQRWITALEAALESSPQALIQLIYLVKTNSFGSNYLVLISLISSLWCIIAKLISDDTIIVVQDAQSANLKYTKSIFTDTIIGIIYAIISVIFYLIVGSVFIVIFFAFCVCWCLYWCCCHDDYRYYSIEDGLGNIADFHKRFKSFLRMKGRFKWISSFYILRVIWRVLDISSHILLMTFIWIAIGGIALTVKVVFESLVIFVICIITKQWEFLFGIIATVISITTDGSISTSISIGFCVYRPITNIIWMILISVWLYTNFECSLCTDYDKRELLINDDNVFIMFIYLWISVISSPFCVYLLFYYDVFKNKASTSRQLEKMIAANYTDGILEMQLYAGHYDIYDEKAKRTLLMLAMQENKTSIVSFLLQKNDKYDAVDKEGENLLDYYMYYKDNFGSNTASMANNLLKICQQNPEMTDKEGRNAFLAGCVRKDIKMISIASKLDKEVFIKDNNDKNFLDYLWDEEQMKDMDSIKMFQQYPQFAEKDGKSPFFSVCKSGNKKQAETLLDLYPDLVNRKDDNNATVLDYYLQHEFLLSTDTLMKIYKLNPTLKSKTGLFTIFLCVCYHGNLECIKQLIEADKNVVNDRSICNMNGVELAKLSNYQTVANYLEENHNISDNISFESDIKHDDIEVNILDNVVRNSVLAKTSILLNIHKENSELKSLKHQPGFTPFLCACYHGNLECVKKIIDSDKTVLADTSKARHNAADIARSRNHEVIVSYLAEHDVKPFQREKNITKLLLLGTLNSGKSTIFKQLTQIYAGGFVDDEFETASKHIQDAVVVQMKNLLNTFKNPENDEFKDDFPKELLIFAKKVSNLSPEQPLSAVVYDIEHLWAHQTIKGAFKNRSNLGISDSAPHFFDNLDNLARVRQYTYRPTPEDILLARIPTTGIRDKEFTIKGQSFNIFDVGGARSERNKWIHCFDDVDGIIFIASLSCYDQMLYEDDELHGMYESIELFQCVVNSRYFRRTAMILLLNKIDLLQEKLKNKSLTGCFPEYDGEDSLDHAVEYIKKKYLEQVTTESRKEIYVHIMNATQQDDIQKVFDMVGSQVIDNALKYKVQ